MLHNTGPYGPGDQPVNMNTSLNLSQMNGMNLVNNISKNVHEQPQSTSGHYNIPNYPVYGSQALNMTSQFPQFPNYNQSAYPTNFSLHNSTSMDYSWHNGMLPMNPPLHNERHVNVINYSQNYDRKITESPINMEIGRKDPRLPSPHIFNKDYLGHGPIYHDNQYNVRPRELEHNIATKDDKIQMDSSRRRSLENTVKLIENILMNTTKQKEYQPVEEVRAPEPLKTQEITPKEINIIEKVDSVPEKEVETADEGEMEKNDAPSQLYKRLTQTQPEIVTENEASPAKDTMENQDLNYDDNSSEMSEDMSQKTEDEDMIQDIEIKVEPASWTDSEFPNPFQRDFNAVPQDEVGESTVIEPKRSVYEAIEAIRNGIKNDKVPVHYECPQCNILIKHPKRFLIHTKWHTMGINKKMELAKKREMRKEARIMEKMKLEDKPQIYQCKDCDKIFSTKSTLKNHRHRFHSSRIIERKVRPRPSSSNFPCPDCNKRFKHKHSLEKHRDTHKEKTHPCAECPKKFGSQVLLKMHMKSHERALRGPTFRCTYCAKGYYEAYTLQVHERTHRNERPFSCDICSATFGTNSSLKRHVRVSHSTSKPYECSTCHRCFVSESIRNRHEQRAHGNPEDFKFICDNCPSRYMKMKDLQRHLCKAHPKAKKSRKPRSDDE